MNTNTNNKKTTIFYKKEGRKYVPAYEYDQELMDAFPKGAHLVMCYPGGKSTRYNVDPNYAALIAACRVAGESMSSAIMKACELRMQAKSRNTPLTPEQKAAWEHLVEVFGDDAKQLEWPSVREIADAGADALVQEAAKLMSHESVKQSYEHFLLTCELTKDHV